MKLLLILLTAVSLSGCFTPGCIVTTRDWQDVDAIRSEWIAHQLNDGEVATQLNEKFYTVLKRPLCQSALIWGTDGDAYEK